MTLLDKVLLVLVLDRVLALRGGILETVIRVKRREVGVGLVVDGDSSAICGTIRVGAQVGTRRDLEFRVRRRWVTARKDHIGVSRGGIRGCHAACLSACTLKRDGFGGVHLRGTACGA
jgi:hypothetical protein